MKLIRLATKILLWIIGLLPVLFLLMLSLSEVWRFPDVVAKNFNINVFIAIVDNNTNLLATIGISLFISTVVSVFSVALGFYFSKTIAYHEKKRLWSFLAYLPFVLSPVIYAACLNYFFVVAGLGGTVFGVMLAQFIIIFPFNIILFLSHWNIRMQSYAELVSTMGGSTRQTFWKVLVPVSIPVLFVALFQSFLISWFEFGLTYFIGTAQIQTLTIKVYQSIGEANIHLAAYSSLLLMIPPLILLFLNRRIVFYTH